MMTFRYRSGGLAAGGVNFDDARRPSFPEVTAESDTTNSLASRSSDASLDVPEIGTVQKDISELMLTRAGVTHVFSPPAMQIFGQSAVARMASAVRLNTIEDDVILRNPDGVERLNAIASYLANLILLAFKDRWRGETFCLNLREEIQKLAELNLIAVSSRSFQGLPVNFTNSPQGQALTRRNNYLKEILMPLVERQVIEKLCQRYTIPPFEKPLGRSIMTNESFRPIYEKEFNEGAIMFISVDKLKRLPIEFLKFDSELARAICGSQIFENGIVLINNLPSSEVIRIYRKDLSTIESDQKTRPFSNTMIDKIRSSITVGRSMCTTPQEPPLKVRVMLREEDDGMATTDTTNYIALITRFDVNNGESPSLHSIQVSKRSPRDASK